MEEQLAAEVKAKNLLRRILPETQWDEFRDSGVLEIPGSRGASLGVSRCRAHATRRISSWDLTRVLDAQTRRLRARICLQLSVPAPVNDRIISEYLLIQNDEDFYWQTANVFPAVLQNRALVEFLLAALDVLLLVLLFSRLRG
jgi:hypothetical protein